MSAAAILSLMGAIAPNLNLQGSANKPGDSPTGASRQQPEFFGASVAN